ncbi:MAG: hypothetical protein WC586_01375 [Methanoregula sp.]
MRSIIPASRCFSEKTRTSVSFAGFHSLFLHAAIQRSRKSRSAGSIPGRTVQISFQTVSPSSGVPRWYESCLQTAYRSDSVTVSFCS